MGHSWTVLQAPFKTIKVCFMKMNAFSLIFCAVTVLLKLVFCQGQDINTIASCLMLG